MENWYKTEGGWERSVLVRPVPPPEVKKKRIVKFYPNWIMISMFLLAIPSAIFLASKTTETIEVQREEKKQAEIQFFASEEEVETIVDSIFKSVKTHGYKFVTKTPEKGKNSRFAEWMWYLKTREGFIPTPYRCPAGYLTVGYGHNIDAHGWKHVNPLMKNGKLTYEGASQLLYNDIKQEVERVTKLAPHLNNNQKLAIAGLFANCGSAKIIYAGGKPKNGHSAFWKKVMKGQVPNFEVYTKYRDTRGRIQKSPNLVSARNFEKLLYQGYGKANIFVGTKKGRPQYQLMTFEEAAEFYKKQLIKRDILPAKLAGNLK